MHLSDLIAVGATFQVSKGLIAVGGFSYGDVLGTGEGWAKAILFNAALKAQFAEFFGRADTVGIGVCNDCQMMCNLKSTSRGT